MQHEPTHEPRYYNGVVITPYGGIEVTTPVSVLATSPEQAEWLAFDQSGISSILTALGMGVDVEDDGEYPEIVFDDELVGNQNPSRAVRGARMLAVYAELYDKGEDIQDVLSDLLADLFHLIGDEQAFDERLNAARYYYLTEREEGEL